MTGFYFGCAGLLSEILFFNNIFVAVFSFALVGGMDAGAINFFRCC